MDGADTRTDDFRRLIRGDASQAVPFWEVWFGMADFQQRRRGSAEAEPTLGQPSIALALDLGMAAVSVGGVPIAHSFAVERMARDGTSHYAGGSLSSPAQLEERPLPDWTGLSQRFGSAVRRAHEAGLAAVVYQPWCFHAIATSMGLERLAYLLYDDRGFLKRCMGWVEERNRRAIREVISEARPDLVLFDGDCAYKTGLMVSPPDFRDLVFEETERTVSLLRGIGIPYAFHTDGKLDDVIPMLVELGFAVVHGCEKQANDLDHLVDRFGDQICLAGNMDVVFLAHATPEEVRRETEEMIARGRRKGRFIAACNTSPLDYIPDENYLAFCQAIQEFGR